MHPNMNPDLNDPALRDALNAKVAATNVLLSEIARDFSPATLANSLGAEDMVLTDLILRGGHDIAIFSLDTGRLPPDTYDLMAAVQQQYGLKLKLF